MKLSDTRLYAASLLLCATLASSASAQFAGMVLVAEETFSYTDGDLNGQGGWASASTSVDAVGGQGVFPSGQTAERSFGTLPALPANYTFSPNGQPLNGLYYYTLQIVSPASARTRGNFNIFGGSNGGDPLLDIPNRQNGWGVRVDDAGSSGTDITVRVLTPATDGTDRPVAFTKPFGTAATITIYGELNFDSTLDVYTNRIWVNPTDTSSISQIAATAVGTSFITGTYASLVGTSAVNRATTFFSTRSFGGGAAMTYDNIALYAAVPEPSTYAALLGAAVLGFAVLRRRASR